MSIEIRIAKQAILASFSEQAAVEPGETSVVTSINEVIPTKGEVDPSKGRDRFVNWDNKYMRIEGSGKQPSAPKVPY